MMNDATKRFTVDEAMAEFMKAAQKRFDSMPPAADAPASPQRTFEEAEAERFRLAERMLARMCPDPGTCSNRRCRRDRLCRHIADLRAMQKGPDPEPLSRRSRGTRALRHAIWVCVNAMQ